MEDCLMSIEERTLSNELILDNIFDNLPNYDLQLAAGLVNPKWNELATKLIYRKRQIFLHNENILPVIKFINGGGIPHKNIRIKLTYKGKKRLLESDFEEISSAFPKFGAGVKILDLESLYSSHPNSDSCGLENFEEYCKNELLLFRQILLNSTNLEELSLKISHSDDVPLDPAELLNIPTLNPLPSLRILELAVESETQAFPEILSSFLAHCPDLKSLHLASELWLEDLEGIEAHFPKFVEKVETLKVIELDEYCAEFLLTRNFCLLKKLEVYLIIDLGGFVKVLEKYSHQLIHLLVGISHYQTEEEDNSVELLTLPVLSNLETLKLLNEGLSLANPQSINFRLWNVEESHQNFPKLVKFEVEFSYECNLFLLAEGIKPEIPSEVLQNLLTATFPKVHLNPKFPGIKKINIVARGLENFKIEPELFASIAKYFPNLTL